MSSQRSAVDQLKVAVGDLIARRDERSDLGDLQRYAADPLGFFRDILRVEPWAKQEEIARSVLVHRKTHVRGGVGVGKDAVGAWLALWWAYCVEGLVLLTSATQRQVVEQMMRREIGRAFHRARLPGELLTTGLRVGTESRMLAFTSSDSASYRGFHDHKILVLISEAFGVDVEAWQGLQDCAVGPDDRILAYGNPISPTGPFYETFRQSGWNKLRVSVLEFPNVLERRVVIPGGVTREWLDGERTDSPFYSSRVLGEFPTSAVNGLVRREWLEAAAELHRAGVLEPQAVGKRYDCALDVAHSEAGDSSCLCTMQGPVSRGFTLWREPDARTLRAHVGKALRALRVYPAIDPDLPSWVKPQYPDGLPPAAAKLFVDARGVGGPVFDELKAERWPVVAYDSSSKAREAQRFSNTRAESHWLLRTKLERHQLAIPYDQDLWDELLAVRWSENEKGQIEVEGKKELRKTLGRSPDRLDALVMAVAGAARATVSGLGFPGQW